MLNFLFIVFSFLSNDTVTVQTRDSHSAFSKFEKDLVEDIFKLYQLRLKKSVTLQWKYKEFENLFTFKDKNTISINAITITEDRKKKYIFSKPYFPIKQAILTTEEKGDFNWKTERTRICVEKNSIHYNTVMKLAKKYNLITVNLAKLGTYTNQIRDNIFDICVSDITTTWDTTNNLIVIDSENDILEVSNYGILYPKDSAIQNDLDNILTYYLRSASYYSIIRKHFGSLAVKYIRSFKS